jgi:hypothetical protein
MSGIDVAAVERIIAHTIVETACGDLVALISRIVAASAEAGYRIATVNLIKDTALGSQPFDELTPPDMRPQDTYGNGRDWTSRPQRQRWEKRWRSLHMVQTCAKFEPRGSSLGLICGSLRPSDEAWLPIRAGSC